MRFACSIASLPAASMTSCSKRATISDAMRTML
jgi:hypothetical protein